MHFLRPVAERLVQPNRPRFRLAYSIPPIMHCDYTSTGLSHAKHCIAVSLGLERLRSYIIDILWSKCIPAAAAVVVAWPRWKIHTFIRLYQFELRDGLTVILVGLAKFRRRRCYPIDRWRQTSTAQRISFCWITAEHINAAMKLSRIHLFPCDLRKKVHKK
jgi:hypothetical protein